MAHGFANAADYYNKASALRVMDRIRVPTLIIHAQDDPFIPFAPLRDSFSRRQSIHSAAGPRAWRPRRFRCRCKKQRGSILGGESSGGILQAGAGLFLASNMLITVVRRYFGAIVMKADSFWLNKLNQFNGTTSRQRWSEPSSFLASIAGDSVALTRTN